MRRRLPLVVPVLLVLLAGCGEEIRHDAPLTVGGLRQAESVAGLSFTDAERDLMLDELRDQRASLGSSASPRSSPSSGDQVGISPGARRCRPLCQKPMM